MIYYISPTIYGIQDIRIIQVKEIGCDRDLMLVESDSSMRFLTRKENLFDCKDDAIKHLENAVLDFIDNVRYSFQTTVEDFEGDKNQQKRRNTGRDS